MFDDWGIKVCDEGEDMTALIRAGRQVRRLKQAISLIKNCHKDVGGNSLDKIVKSLEKELKKLKKKEEDRLR